MTEGDEKRAAAMSNDDTQRERLLKVEITTCSTATKVNEIDNKMGKLLGRFDSFLMGDGTKDNPGMLVRMDRVDQFVSQVKWVLGVIATAVIGILVKMFFFGGKAPP